MNGSHLLRYGLKHEGEGGLVRWVRAFGVTVLAAALIGAAGTDAGASEAFATFADGGTTTQVDGWRGKAGGNWTNAWTVPITEALVTNVVLTSSPQSGDSDSNYLFIRQYATGAITSGRQVAVRRSFDASVIPVDGKVAISWLLRLDINFNSSLDWFRVLDRAVPAANAIGDTWQIDMTSPTGYWRLAGGSSQTSTIPVMLGHSVRFILTAVPNDEGVGSLQLKIEDLTDAVEWTSDWLPMRNSVSRIGNSFQIQDRVLPPNLASDKTREFAYSLGEVKITPVLDEVSTATVILLR